MNKNAVYILKLISILISLLILFLISLLLPSLLNTSSAPIKTAALLFKIVTQQRPARTTVFSSNAATCSVERKNFANVHLTYYLTFTRAKMVSILTTTTTADCLREKNLQTVLKCFTCISLTLTLSLSPSPILFLSLLIHSYLLSFSFLFFSPVSSHEFASTHDNSHDTRQKRSIIDGNSATS